MQCKSCNTELAKHNKVCPKCGTPVGKGPKNLKVLAIAGVGLTFLGGMLPFIQNTEDIDKAYSFMNIDQPVYWYLFMLALIVSMLLIVVKKEIFSIISTVVSIAIFAVAFFVPQYSERVSLSRFELHYLTDLLNDGEHAIGIGIFVMIAGVIIAVAGCFIDILKYFKKELDVDARFLTNTVNRNLWSKIYTYRWFYLMFLPVLVMILLFNYWPMLGIRYALTDYKIRNPYYVGLKHFYEMFTEDTYFWVSFKNTLVLSIVRLTLNTSAAIIISLLLHEMTSLLFKKTVQTIIYLPHFMSWVVIGALFSLILSPSNDGLVNSVLSKLGMFPTPKDGIYFMGDKNYWTGTFFMINVWKDSGWGTILFLATLSGISPELYEAAQIDGANRWNRMRFITLPALANTIITVFILNLAKVMNLFEAVFVLMNDAVFTISTVLQTYIFDRSFGAGSPNYGYTTSVGIFSSVVSMIMVLGCNYASKKVRGRGIV